MEKIKVINITDEDEFEREVNKLLLQGYKISSTSCGFVNSESYDFCTSFQAILVLDLVIDGFKKQKPIKTKILETSKYEDGEPFDNLACGKCECILIPNIKWTDLDDDKKRKLIVEQENIETSEWKYCPECGQKIDWN